MGSNPTEVDGFFQDVQYILTGRRALGSNEANIYKYNYKVLLGREYAD